MGQGGYGRGTIPGTTQLLGEGPTDSEAGPGGPAGAGVGGQWEPGEPGDGGGPRTHPAGPVGHLQCPPWF